MSIREQDVDDLLSRALPEFALAVREHRLEWAEQPMLYPLVGSLFNLLVDSSRMAQPSGDLARRAYEVVEKALTEGMSGVKDLFAIEMIEPLAGDPHHEFYPNFESLMGTASLAKLAAMREWGRRYSAMSAAVDEANRMLGRSVFLQHAGIDGDNARVIANIEQWNLASAEERLDAVLMLTRSWRELCEAVPEESKPILQVTGPAETGFQILWEP